MHYFHEQNEYEIDIDQKYHLYLLAKMGKKRETNKEVKKI